MIISIPDNVLEGSPEELLLEMAVYLYEKKILTIGQASRLAQQNLIAFQKQLAGRHIPIHYSESDLQKDLRNLNQL